MKDEKLLFNEIWDNDRALFEDIARQTKQGHLHWELYDYLPLGILSEELFSEAPACISQSFEFQTTIAGLPYDLSIMETVNLKDYKGDIAICLTRDVEDRFMKRDLNLSMDFDYDDCAPEELAEKYKDHPAMILANTLIPQNLDTDEVKSVMTWARYYNEVDAEKRYGTDRLNKLCEKLFREQRLPDFHRILFDIPYRNKLMGEQI